jgi:predicted DNA-binding transcriptional regulator AlpA
MEPHIADRATNDHPRFVDEKQLAEMTGISRRTWQRHRLHSQGPRFYKICGSVRYDLNEVLVWIRSLAGGSGKACDAAAHLCVYRSAAQSSPEARRRPPHA